MSLELGEKLAGVVGRYLARVESALLNAPLIPSEAAVQEWCLRLDDLRHQSRRSEVEHLHRWLVVAFGRGSNDRPLPLDPRIHRRLGELYLGARRYERAVEQFRLAWHLAPRDIFILRLLGQAHLGKQEYEATGEILERIAQLDEHAFVHNTECAALKGRWYREMNDLESARAVYDAALRSNDQSYYFADLLGQTSLALGDL